MDVLKASVMCSRATLFGIATWALAKEKEAYDTGYSQAVTHPSTNPARPGLTSVIGREPVYSRWYGRKRKTSRQI